ncbi:MAG TPA: hypothetical protein VFE03_03940 [Caulobacteraceae bacterium]|jgi:hypothetical protein|nr:hypothetical protein [Caulobacteraceae bacterium]
MSRAFALAASLAVLAAAPSAWADEAIPTANDESTPATTASPPPLEDPGPLADNDDIVRIGPCGAVQRASDKGPIDKQAHGEIDVGIGTHGYRHIGGVVCKPIGENGSVTIAVDHTEWGGYGRRRLAEAQTAAEPPNVSMGRVR